MRRALLVCATLCATAAASFGLAGGARMQQHVHVSQNVSHVEPRAQRQLRSAGRGMQGVADEPVPISYLSYTDMIARLHRLADTAPELVRMWSAQRSSARTFAGGASPPFVSPLPSPGTCGDNGEACEHWFVTLTNSSAASNVSTRPQVFLSGNLHGDEVVGPITLLYLLEHLVRSAQGGNPWTAWLLAHRLVVALVISNPLGFVQGQREENGVDPNRDFPFQQDAATCMRSVTARAINEVWRAHLFVAGITFHGGMEAIAYEWGAPSHVSGVGTSAYAESPDDASQAATSHVMSAAAGALRGHRYPVDRMTVLVYAVSGGMEDWAYAGSWETASVPTCTPDTYGGYPAALTQNYAPGALRAFNVLIEADDAKRPASEMLGAWSDATSLMVEGSGDGHVPRNVRLAYAMLDMAAPYVVYTRFSAVVVNSTGTVLARKLLRGAGHEEHAPRHAQDAATGQASVAGTHPIAAVLCPAASAAHCAHNAHADAYDAWMTLDVSHTGCAAPGEAQSVLVRVGWDVGGGIHVDETSLLVGAWDARVSPRWLLNSSLSDVDAQDAAHAVAVNTSLTHEEALSLVAYVRSWQAVLLGRVHVSDALAANPGIQRPSTPRSTVTRWMFGDLGAQPEPLDGVPPRWNAGHVQGAPDLARAPFTTRAAERINVTLASVASIASCAAANASGDVTITEAFFVVPYAILDAAWRRQNSPEPAIPPQTHFTNIRSDASWHFTNGDFEVRGRTHAVPDEIQFVAVSRTLRRVADAPLPSSAPHAAGAPASADELTDAPSVPCAGLAMLPLTPGAPAASIAQDADPMVSYLGVRTSSVVMYAAVVSGGLAGVFVLVALQLRGISQSAGQYAPVDLDDEDREGASATQAGDGRAATARSGAVAAVQGRQRQAGGRR